MIQYGSPLEKTRAALISRHNSDSSIWVVMSMQDSFQLIYMDKNDSVNELQRRLQGAHYNAVSCMADRCRKSRKWQVLTDEALIAVNSKLTAGIGLTDDA